MKTLGGMASVSRGVFMLFNENAGLKCRVQSRTDLFILNYRADQELLTGESRGLACTIGMGSALKGC